MMRRFLKETPSGGIRSLTVGRHQVHDSWDQIQAYLGSVLSQDHAALFAEPFHGAGTVSWMASTPTDPLPFDRLDPEAQERALARLETLLGDISGFATARAASRSDEDQQWAALLTAIQQQPSAIPLTERLFVAGDQPVLILWGCRDEATVATDNLLRETRKAIANPPPIKAAPRPPVPGEDAPIGATAMPVAVEPTRGWWLPALLWALFVATLALIYWLLLAACALHLPPSFPWVGACELRNEVAQEQARRDDLLAELQRLRNGLVAVDQCRIEGGPGAPWTAPPVVPPAPVPQPEPPQDEAPPQDPAETDIDRARDEAGGQVGDVTITLLWNGASDLDLVIRCPNGEHVTGANSQGQLRCGGRIDVDANYCSRRPGPVGSVCDSYAANPTDSPVENAYFNEPGAMAGQFEVLVRHYAAAKSGGSAPVPFVVQLRRGEDRQRFDGTASPGSLNDVAAFQID